MKRPIGVTIIAILTFFGATILALGSCAFFFVAFMAMTGVDAAEPISVAIVGMAIAGGFSLLVLSGVDLSCNWSVGFARMGSDRFNRVDFYGSRMCNSQPPGKRRHPRPGLDLFDRLFWITARQLWSEWKQALIVVTPETVVRWHQAGFHLYWKLISRVRKPVGRRRTSKEVQEFVGPHHRSERMPS
jgi:hypothetical protein